MTRPSPGRWKPARADYLVKPFSPAELVARVRAALRGQAGADPFVLGDLAIDYEQRRVTMAGRPVKLTLTEYELLRALSINAGRVTTYKLAAARCVGRTPGRCEARAHLRQATPPQARGRCGQTRLHPHRTAGSATAWRRPEGTARSTAHVGILWRKHDHRHHAVRSRPWRASGPLLRRWCSRPPDGLSSQDSTHTEHQVSF